jgi:hypothetical protein
MKHQPPSTYRHWIYSRDLPLIDSDEDGNVGNMYTDSTTIKEILLALGFAKSWLDSFTALYVVSKDGDYDAVWLSMSNAPWDNFAVFYALSSYRAGHISLKHAPECWRETNPYYNQPFKNWR